MHADRRRRQLFAAALERTGYAVLAACAGEPAMDVLSSVSRGELPKPEIVVIDIERPIHSGLRVLAAVRAAEPTVPVIVLSPPLGAPLRAVIDGFEVFACMTKPVSPALLARALAAALNERRTDGGPADP